MDNYTIVINDEAWEKILAYVDLIDKEIAAFGYIEPHESGYMYVKDVFLVPQEVSGSEVDFTSEGLNYAVEKSIEDDCPEQLRFLMHSHVNMGAFWSDTDEQMIEKLGSTGAPWFVNVVMNKKGEHKCRLDLFETGVPGLGHVRNIELAVMPEGALAINESAMKEIDKFVKVQKPKFMQPNNKNNKNNKGYNKNNKGSKKHPPKSESTEMVKWSNSWSYDDDENDEAFELYFEAIQKGWIIAEDASGTSYFYEDDGPNPRCVGSCPTPDAWVREWLQYELDHPAAA